MALVSIVTWPFLLLLFGWQIDRERSAEATRAGFESYDDLRLAQEAGVTDPKAFYADIAAIRVQVDQKRKKEARELVEAETRKIRERATAEAATAARAAAEARKAKYELAEAAPLDQQPRHNTDFGRVRRTDYLLTAAGYPFVRAQQDVPLCGDPWSAKQAGDAMRAKDRRWAESIRNCAISPEGTAVEWTKESLVFAPVVELRIRSPEGGRITVYAPDNSTDGIPFWMGLYSVSAMRAEASAKAR